MEVLLTYDYGLDAIEKMKNLGYEVILVDEKEIKKGVLQDGLLNGKDLRGIEILICYDPFDGLDISWFPSLKWIQLSSIGFDQVPEQVRVSGAIEVTNNHGGYSKPIGEWVVMNLLEIYKNRKETWQNQVDKRWRLNSHVCELVGRRIGFLGTGTLAQESAKRLAGFEIEAIGFNTKGRQTYPFDQCHPMDNLDEWLPELDALVVTLPDTKSTAKLLDDQRLRLMKRDSVLVNVSRGAIIDESALIGCLADGWFKGVALDVFEKEPLDPDSPLWGYERVYLSAHNSWYSERRNSRRLTLILDNLERFRDGEPLLNTVDLIRGY